MARNTIDTIIADGFKISAIEYRGNHDTMAIDTLVLRYKSLDNLFGRYLLPFVVNVSKLDGYNHILNMNIVDSNYNPILSIIDIYTHSNINEYEVVLHKIAATAANRNTISYRLEKFGFDFFGDIRKKAEGVAEMEVRFEWAEIEKCPVCGCKSLVKYSSCEDSEDNEGNIIAQMRYVYKVKCHQCGFTLNDWLIDNMDQLKTYIPSYKDIQIYK